MNDYFLKILARQRHEEILAEFRGINLSRRENPRTTGIFENITDMLRSCLVHFKRNERPITN